MLHVRVFFLLFVYNLRATVSAGLFYALLSHMTIGMLGIYRLLFVCVCVCVCVCPQDIL